MYHFTTESGSIYTVHNNVLTRSGLVAVQDKYGNDIPEFDGESHRIAEILSAPKPGRRAVFVPEDRNGSHARGVVRPS
jgi:hypothetical protein